MEIIGIKSQKVTSQILIGESIKNLHKYIPQNNTFIITDGNVERIYRDSFPDLPVFIFGAGESSAY